MNHFFDLIEEIYEVFIISSGISLNFFDLIFENKQLTSDELAKIKGHDSKMIKAWCDAAVACHYLKVDKASYSLQRWTRSYLTRKSPSNLGFLFEAEAVKMMLHPFLSDLEERFKGNHPPFEKEHILAIPNTIKKYAPLIIPIIRQNVPKLMEKCHVLDIGTGIGAYLINFAESNTALTGVGIDIQDLTIQEAKKSIKEKKLDDRLEFIAMDARKLSLEEEFDIIFISNMIQALNYEDAKTLIKKVYKILKRDGYLVILEILVNDDRVSPKLGAITNFYLKMEMIDAGTYCLKDLQSFINDAGFTRSIIDKQMMSQSYLIYTQK